MRVATKTRYDQIKNNLARISEEMNKANNVVSSGKRIMDLSDDPVGLTQALKIKSTLKNIEQLGRNISVGNSCLNAAEGALSQTQNLLSDVKVLCIQMANDTIGAEQRQGASLTVQNTLDEIISLANTQIGGRYIFAGTKTDTAAFASDGTYNGDNDSFSVKIGQTTTIAVGSDGDAIFSNIFDTLNNIISDLQTNNRDGISSALDVLETDSDNISNKISDIGSKMVRMEIKGNILQDSTLANTERLSLLEDADIMEAIIELKSKELAYQASLASSAKVMELSLVDYIR